MVTRAVEQSKMTFERKCYWNILRIGCTQTAKRIDLYRRIQLKENIMQKLIGRKMGLFGHLHVYAEYPTAERSRG